MAIQARQSAGKEFTPAPKGVHQAVLIGVVDRGEQPNKFQDNRLEPKLSFHFEIAATDPETGERYQFSRWVTNSTYFSPKTGKMSGMMEMLTQWLDTDAVPPVVLEDLEILCGLNARVRLVHQPKEDGTGFSVKLSSIEPWDESKALLEPSQGVGEGEVFRAKSVDELVQDTSASLRPQHTPAPAPPTQQRTTITNGHSTMPPGRNQLTKAEMKKMALEKMKAEFGDDDDEEGGADIFDGE